MITSKRSSPSKALSSSELMGISQLLLQWYQKNARELPWRSAPQPYRTWISEVMLQQTQVETVLPYFERWMMRFPDLTSLAVASEQEVLALWEGLGYYSRARNIWKTAQFIMDQYDGVIPGSVQELIKLPGIGDYIAAAIASIAFGADVAALDGNIKRVYARCLDLDSPLGTPDAENQLKVFADQQLPVGRAGDLNQALMDLGAMVCIPGKPRCDMCPLTSECLAFQNGTQSIRPVKKVKPKVPHYMVTAAVISSCDRVLIARRPANGLLGNLWEFPGGKLQDGDPDLAACLQREIMEEMGCRINVGEPFGVYSHAYTHFKITLHAFLCSLVEGEQPQLLHHEQIVWVERQKLKDFPMGKVDRMIANKIKAG
jgi:A/G-specific adenine glycosylase